MLVGSVAALIFAGGLAVRAAEAQILLGKGIGPVRLGQTCRQVLRELGRPYADFGAELEYLSGPLAQTTVFLVGGGGLESHCRGTVNGIITSSPHQRTKRGHVGFGSTLQQVKRAFPGGQSFPGAYDVYTFGQDDKIMTQFQFGTRRFMHGKVIQVYILDLGMPCRC